jgi:hypothetical protein
MKDSGHGKPSSSERPGDQEVTEIRNAIRGIQYGSVQIFVQDGVIVQIDRTEKLRLTKRRPKQG